MSGFDSNKNPSIYTIVAALLAAPADATTYYFGPYAGLPPMVAGSYLFPQSIRKAGSIKNAFIFWNSTGVAGSNENISIYLKINGTTDYLIQTIGNVNSYKEFISVNINIPVNYGDYFELKLVCPTWATNPTNVALGGHVYVF